ncbi:MAG: topoisomerase [Rhodoglobus sp.]|nr:topoisomerase [Rhodoglobus sp.]
MSIARAAALWGPAFTREQLLAVGVSPEEVIAAVRLGQLHRVRKGRYVLPTAPPEVVLAVTLGGALAGPSAARTYKIWSGFDLRTHVSVRPNASRFGEAARAVVHWDGKVLRRECWRVDVGECIRQIVRWSDSETGLAAVETALEKRLVTPSSLRLLFAGENAAARLLVGAARPGCGSGTESIVSRRLRALDIEVRRQVRIDGVGDVDMGVVGTRVVIEVDGRSYHEDPAAFENDRRRDAELVRRGFVVVRLSYDAVVTRWPWCERMVLGALAAHGQ